MFTMFNFLKKTVKNVDNVDVYFETCISNIDVVIITEIPIN